MGLKPSGLAGLLVVFVGLVIAAGALLLSRPDATVPAPRFATAAAVAPAPKPVDQRFVIKRILPISGPIRYGEWHWDEAGVPD